MELIRSTDQFFTKFGQCYVSLNYPGVVRAWHYHKKQEDYFVVVQGMCKVGLYDMREVRRRAVRRKPITWARTTTSCCASQSASRMATRRWGRSPPCSSTSPQRSTTQRSLTNSEYRGMIR